MWDTVKYQHADRKAPSNADYLTDPSSMEKNEGVENSYKSTTDKIPTEFSTSASTAEEIRV